MSGTKRLWSALAGSLFLSLIIFGGARASVVYNGGSSGAATIPGPYSGLFALTANQSTTTAVVTQLSGFTAIFDNGTFYAGGSPTRFTIPASGRYQLSCMIIYENTSGVGERYLRLHKNGSFLANLVVTSGAIGNYVAVNGSIILNLSITDYLELCSLQSSGGNINVLGGTFGAATVCYFSIVYCAGQ